MYLMNSAFNEKLILRKFGFKTFDWVQNFEVYEYQEYCLFTSFVKSWISSFSFASVCSKVSPFREEIDKLSLIQNNKYMYIL
jgi:hypothetical protein